MTQAFPKRITQARELAGFSKSDLATLLHVSPAAVTQWERGSKNPTADKIAALAHYLQVPMPLLMKPIPDELSLKGPVTFRAWNSAKTRRANKRAERLAELVAEVFLWLEKRVTFPKNALPEFEYNPEVESLASECRRAWGLGDRPLLKLGELLESKGIVIGSASFGDTRFDAFSCIINGRPFIFLGDEKSDNARSRFDAAHELCHLLLHQNFAESDLLKRDTLNTIEREANAFAGAFLMPAETFRLDVLSTTLDAFLKLKAKWCVSVQAMVMRAYGLHLITENQYRELFRQMGMKGWRRAAGEPFSEMIPPVRSSLGERGLEVLESHSIIRAWEIPTELPFPPKLLHAVFNASEEKFGAVKMGKLIPLSQVQAASPFEAMEN